MIHNVSTTAGTDFIDITWSVPSILPWMYKISISCWLLCTEIEYKWARFDTSPYRTTQNVDGLLPGSICTFILQAVYNPASVDDGIVRTVLTMNASMYV